ncbi:hypothetical protein Tco_1348144, partial [Tanacetum coccineum]
TASGDFGVSTAGGINQVPSTPCANDVVYSFLAQPTTSPQLENEDFQLMDGDDLEELDLRWQVAMLTVRVKKKGHFARECRSRRNQGRRSYGDNGRSNAPTTESSSQALVAQDGLGGYDWSNDFEVEPVNQSPLQAHQVLLTVRGYEKALESLESRIASLDEYAIRKKIIESKTTDLNTKTSKTVGKTNKANTQKPKTVYESVNTKTIFGDAETNAQVLITMIQNKKKEKEKGVEISNVEDTERPRPTSTRSIFNIEAS